MSPSTHRFWTHKVSVAGECKVFGKQWQLNWTRLDKRSHAASNSTIPALDYRLAPEHPFPAALADTIQAFFYLLHLGYKQKDIVFAGDSAGGNLSAASLQYLRDCNYPMPGGAMLFSVVTTVLQRDVFPTLTDLTCSRSWISQCRQHRCAQII